jgi:hypothetical protein
MIRLFKEFFRHMRGINDAARGLELPSCRAPLPPMPTIKSAKKPCRACYGGDLPCVCSSYPKSRDADMWDVGQAAASDAAHEPGHIEYRFLGITGMEDE